MAKHKDDIGQPVRDVIERVLRERLGGHGYRAATVVAGRDHDGNAILRIEAHFDLIPEPMDLGITVGVVSALREALEDINEERFPIVTYDISDEQPILEKKRKRTRA